MTSREHGRGHGCAGPDALNAAAGLGTAYASSSPVLLISGQIPSASLGKREGQLHEIEDQLDVFKPITKWNHRVSRVDARNRESRSGDGRTTIGCGAAFTYSIVFQTWGYKDKDIALLDEVLGDRGSKKGG